MRVRPVVFAALMFRLVASAAGEIVFVAPTNHAMPLVRFEDGELKGGFLKEVGDAIAQRLGREAHYLAVPSKRVSMALARGDADCLCYVLPRWLDGEFNWSRPIVNDSGVVLARPEAPHLNSLQDLAGQRVGTVSGYRYPQMDEGLGARFLRDDAPTAEHNLRKLLVGRSQYAIVDGMMADYQMRTNPQNKLRVDLVINRFQAQCAFSRHAKVDFAEMNHAVDTLIDDGSIDRLLSHYR